MKNNKNSRIKTFFLTKTRNFYIKIGGEDWQSHFDIKNFYSFFTSRRECFER